MQIPLPGERVGGLQISEAVQTSEAVETSEVQSIAAPLHCADFTLGACTRGSRRIIVREILPA